MTGCSCHPWQGKEQIVAWGADYPQSGLKTRHDFLYRPSDLEWSWWSQTFENASREEGILTGWIPEDKGWKDVILGQLESISPTRVMKLWSGTISVNKKKKKKKRCTWRNQYLEACYYGEHTGHFLLVKTELQKQQLNRSLNEEGRNLKVEFMAWSPLQARVMCLASTVKRQDTQLKWDRRLEFWFKLAENSLLPESKQYVPKQSYNLKWWGN